jgi:cytochrome c peroxidase
MFSLLMLASCERAHRFPAPAKPSGGGAESKDDDRFLYRFSWVEPRVTHDVPILFVPDANQEWQGLKDYWNELKFPTGMPTAHLGLAPMQALAALALSERHQAVKIAAVKIKVPLGLSDPTDLIPTSNPPTLGKWRLGHELFHEPLLQADQGPYSCASCHKPEEGFAERRKHSIGGSYNTLSLINVAYNQRQFWDGRVKMLEETLVRSLADERAVDPRQRSQNALQHHNWGGFVRELVASKRYNDKFKLVFGLDEHPTQDAVSQALATYMRTILSGDSLYDRASQIRKEKKAEALATEHFLALLGKKDKNGKSLAVWRDELGKEQDLSEADLNGIATGYELFQGAARCARCHTGPLFTDHDFHNVGYEGKEAQPDIGTESGRAMHVPVGLKQSRLIGAFRTPSLRNLSTTAPYFHNGVHYTLSEVVEFYDSKVLWTRHLAKALKDGEEAQKLRLTQGKKDALVMFLRALEGTPVDSIVATPPKQ